LVGWSQATSAEKLAEYEDKVLENVSEFLERRHVCVNNNQYIWTLCSKSVSAQLSASTPVVLLHGVGSGAALWVLNLASIASQRAVYALDMLGFGRSSRVMFSSDPAVAEMEFVESLESWRKAMGLARFILVGHCFGGYIATSYAIRYPDRVRHLVLVDPWGFQQHQAARPTAPGHEDRKLPMPLWVRSLSLALQPFNPFAALRVVGSWGPALVARFKPDLIQKFSHLFSDDTVAQYIYHWNAQTPSGETAFKHMSHDFGWAHYPMLDRVKDIASFVSMTLICGARSLTDTSIGRQIQEQRQDSFIDTHIVNGAGHFVFADKAGLFNKLLQHTCTLVDHRLDVVPTRSALRNRLRRVRSESSPNLQRVMTFNRRRRCDSQRITEEQETGPPGGPPGGPLDSSAGPLGSAAAAEDGTASQWDNAAVDSTALCQGQQSTDSIVPDSAAVCQGPQDALAAAANGAPPSGEQPRRPRFVVSFDEDEDDEYHQYCF
jgi:pimeloyl-ACP methyl ester carboxylesterase